MIFDKNQFGYLSLIFATLSGVPYIWSVLKKETRPHVFTWILWSLLSAIAAAAQYAGDAGPGAWAAAIGAIFSLITLLLSVSHGDKSITRYDWGALILGLSALPLWYLTTNPLTAVTLATLIDAVGYIPTFRKSYTKPKEEMIFSYIVSNFKHIASICAMVEYSATTLMYPIVLFAMNGALIIMLVLRRYVLSR